MNDSERKISIYVFWVEYNYTWPRPEDIHIHIHTIKRVRWEIGKYETNTIINLCRATPAIRRTRSTVKTEGLRRDKMIHLLSVVIFATEYTPWDIYSLIRNFISHVLSNFHKNLASQKIYIKTFLYNFHKNLASFNPNYSSVSNLWLI